jgi:diaminohydroxyphosphoribosylaminopyrimidine deaminase/5-amino-6-(5-phosphoribosylamino)uracil reductase
MQEEERFMRRAIELAERGLGSTSPNPPVGAVIIQNGGVVGEGWHEYAGGPHAEVNAIKAAGMATNGAAMYVSLEPCNIFGKTPPCVDAIIQAGIAKVVVGTGDPNPAVNGKGVQALRAAGVEVEESALKTEAETLIEAYGKHIRTGRPFLTMKVAMSLDARIATKTGSSRWITSEGSRVLVHKMRAASDAVMTGIGTVKADDPRLDVRIEGYEGRQPARIIVDARGAMPLDSLIMKTAADVQTIIATTDVMTLETTQRMADAGAEIIVVPQLGDRIDLGKLLDELGKRGMCSILLEAGSALATAFISEGLVDKYAFFIAPKLIGGTAALSFYGGVGAEDIKDADALSFGEPVKVGGDIFIEAYPKN